MLPIMMNDFGDVVKYLQVERLSCPLRTLNEITWLHGWEAKGELTERNKMYLKAKITAVGYKPISGRGHQEPEGASKSFSHRLSGGNIALVSCWFLSSECDFGNTASRTVL